MSDPEQKKGRAWEEGGPERLYVLTSGRKPAGRQAPLDMVTLIVSRGEAGPGMQPELAAIVRICDYPLSVAEVSAYLHLPVSVVTVLLTELLASGHVEARASVPAKSLPDIELLEAVMHGLQNL
ncbi:hypothetical protein ADK86_33475 [Streptomyces sp. NRRL F-5755]|uniref:DUF742 domain-containing protein n=1 Tax=Streptomyces sp. NRRL F-5755 TaxID=1519475 RepID=UPI0006AEC877|nr:DUF742 domain-containing protein [Streptomyces sp. NRRL F-5755]KOT88149.1 hypothetical protein ADK86_33475 [Streptomyces sp. NRRL F-5755]